MRRLTILATVLITVVWLSADVRAQETTSGTITGKVTEPTGRGIPGAVVIATSAFGTRTADTDANGHYVLPFLRPGLYSLRVEAPGGFTTVIRSDVAVGLSQRLQLDFTLEPGKTETITVTGAAPLVDTKSTSSSTNIKYDDFANAVPLGRSFTDTYAVAAGVVSGLGTGQGNYSISGASGLENSYLIDGVNITNTGYGGIGAYNIIYGSLGTGVTSEFLDEVQIKTAGFEAEYGQALGGIINTIVKSGTNDLKGSVAWYASPDAFRGSSTLVKRDTGNTNLVGETVDDFAFSIGGPIRKDKLFFFVAYNPVITTQQRRATDLANPAFAAQTALVEDYNGNPVFNEASNPNGYGVAARTFPSSTGILERKRTANNYAIKFSWQASPRHLVELSAFGDPANGEDGPQRDNAPQYIDFASGGGESRLRYGSNNQALKWNAVFSPKFFMEAQIAHHDGKFRERSALVQVNFQDLRNTLEFVRGATRYLDPASGSAVPFELLPQNTRRGGIGFTTDQDDTNTQYLVKFTSILGNHELKYGAEYNDISYRDTAVYTGPSFNINFGQRLGGRPLDADGDGIQDPLILTTRGGGLVTVRNTATDGPGQGDVALAYDTPNIFRVIRTRISPEAPATNALEYDAFIQDTWTLHPRLTLKAGLRFTEEKIEGSGEYTLALSSGPTTFTPSEYTFTGNYAPRLGLIWDVLGNGKSRAWVNWGRYFERVPNDLAVRAFSNEVGVSRVEFTDRDLTAQSTSANPRCNDGLGGEVTCIAVNAFTQGLQPTSVVKGVKLPYEDELSGGYSFEITPNSSFEVRAIYRTQGRVLEDTQVNAIEQVENYYYGYLSGYPYDPFGGSPSAPQSTAFPAAPFGAYELANPGTNRVPTGGTFSFPKPTRRYKALELVYTKRFSDNWSLFMNYRFSRTIGNYEGLFRNDNGQSDPNLTSQYDFPNSPLMSGQFVKGPLPSDRPHVLHVYPAYQFANKFRIGASFSWASGVPRTSLLAHPNYQNAGEIAGINPVYAYWADPTPDASTGACTLPDCELRQTKNLSDALSDPESFGFAFLKSYTPVTRGNLGRTPDVVSLDLHADYPLQFGKSTLRLMLDVFNVFASQEPTLFDDNIELQAGVPDPDFLKPIEYQDPRSWRMAARWEF